jgi:cyclic-di-AMP phosphodiesterase PgpH
VDDPVRRYWLIRGLIGAIILMGVPSILAVPAFLADSPIRVGEPSPRTVIAPSLIRVEDLEATERARRDAAESVAPIYEFDVDAQTEVVSQVRDWFAHAEAVREPAEPPPPVDEEEDEPEAAATPSPEEQIEALEDRLWMLDREGLALIVDMGDGALSRITEETIGIAQELARRQIREEELERVIDRELPTEIGLRDIRSDVAEHVVEPMIREAMRPTVTVNEEATARARRDAAASVDEVVRSFSAQSVIISAGEQASPVQVAALERVGLLGADPRWEFLRALGITAIALAVVAAFLRAYRPRIWRSNRDILLLTVLVFGYAVLLAAVAANVVRHDIWLYAVPVGALAMLATILLGPAVGVLSAIPATLLTAFVASDAPGVIAFAAAASLVSVPAATRLSARGQLRRSTLAVGVGYILLAGLFALVFSGIENTPNALLAGAIHGGATAMIVLGGLPFLESAFGIVTATSLIDLADRNHPLLRELEQKALGSYNHSIVVATLVERACRAIGADALLGSVAALYHDIGKVRRPYFFVENQFGIRNPHDDLEPTVSAEIIHRHVEDGIEMADTYKLPPEVVDGIATHHGTTLVTYFYLEAIRRSDEDDEIDEAAFRYKGRKPRTKETAVLMLADCCEAASRAAAQNDRNLTREQLIDLVEALFADRIDDGQLDESPLTFRDLGVVRESFIETLVGVYHPRVAYPSDGTEPRPGRQPAPAPAQRDGDAEATRAPEERIRGAGAQRS